MNAINISLPGQLKNQADELVKKGYYASFSDLVRTSIRELLKKSKHDIWADEAMEELKRGEVPILRSNKDIDKFIKTVVDNA